jgi:superoxide dismutase, Cu-Zn family
MKRQWLGVAMVSVMATSGWAWTGVAQLKGTADGSPIKGTAKLEDTAGGLHVQLQVANIPDGQHGFHIHEYGQCDEMGKAAGSHYNPTGANHGNVMKAGPKGAHAGDMGNLIAKNGTASLDVTIPGVTLSSGSFTVAGRAVVVHEKADDFSQPVGNAGGRIACGPIVITGSN